MISSEKNSKFLKTIWTNGFHFKLISNYLTFFWKVMSILFNKSDSIIIFDSKIFILNYNISFAKNRNFNNINLHLKSVFFFCKRQIFLVRNSKRSKVKVI